MGTSSFNVISVKHETSVSNHAASVRSSRSFPGSHSNNDRAYSYGDEFELLDGDSYAGPGGWNLSFRDWMVLGCVAVLVLMDAFNATVLITVLPTLSNSLQVPLSAILWSQTGYLLSNAAAHAFFPMLSEIVGHGALLFSGLMVSTIGTGVGCRAGTLAQLLSGRMLQGFGGGGMTSLSLFLVAKIVPPCQRATVCNFVWVARLVGAVFGPVAGGLFADRHSWNWAFYFNFILCAAGLLMVPFAVRFELNKSIELRRLRTMDWSGMLLVFLGVGSLLIGITWGGTSYAWDSWRTLIPIAAGASGIVALGFYERVWALNPFFDGGLFAGRVKLAANLGCFLQGVLIFCQLQYLALYLASVKYMSPTLTGLGLMAITGAMLPTALVEGFLINHNHKHAGAFHWTIWAGWMMTILSTGCMILLNAHTLTGGWVLMFVAAGIGHGLLLSGYNLCLHAWTTEDQSHQAMKMYSFLRVLGMCVAGSVGGCVLLNRVVVELDRLGMQGVQVVDSAQGYLILLQRVKLSHGEREALKVAYAAAFRFLWQVMSGVAALGGLSSFFVRTVV